MRSVNRDRRSKSESAIITMMDTQLEIAQLHDRVSVVLALSSFQLPQQVVV
jgi:hypothetical protein